MLRRWVRKTEGYTDTGGDDDGEDSGDGGEGGVCGDGGEWVGGEAGVDGWRGGGGIFEKSTIPDMNVDVWKWRRAG